jgi:hypothetical protein
VSGLTLSVKVTPRAKRAGLLGATEDGTLRLAVTEPAEGGRANAAVLRLLAETLGVAPSSCTLLRGAAARQKHVRVAGDPALLSARLAAAVTP